MQFNVAIESTVQPRPVSLLLVKRIQRISGSPLYGGVVHCSRPTSLCGIFHDQSLIQVIEEKTLLTHRHSLASYRQLVVDMQRCEVRCGRCFGFSMGGEH